MSLRRAGVGGRRWVRAVAVVLPLLISAAWIPVRNDLPNVDAALALVLAVTVCGATARRSYLLLGAVGAAAGFAFFDTQPYEHFVVSRQPDLETLIILVVVSLVTGELAIRVTRARAGAVPSDDDMARVRDVASLVASGAELVDVLAAVGDELCRLLDARSCSYEAGPSPAAALAVERDGGLRGVPGAAALEVPVTGMGRVIGRFVVTGPAATAPRGRLLVALTLADQAGAALIAQAPESAEPAPGDDPFAGPALRVVK